MKTFFLIAIFATMITCEVQKCTAAVKDMVDDVFLLVEDAEANKFNISAGSIKAILTGVTEIMRDCAGKDLDLNQYDNCVDGIMPTIPMIGKLVDDIKSGETNNIMLDVTQIGLQLANGITVCLKKSKIQELMF